MDESQPIERSDAPLLHWSVLCFAAVYGHVIGLVLILAIVLGVYLPGLVGLTGTDEQDAIYTDWATGLLLHRFHAATAILFVTAMAVFFAGWRTAPRAHILHGLLAQGFAFALVYSGATTWA